MSRGIALTKVKIFGEEALGGVVVSVHDDGGEMEPASLLRNGDRVRGSESEQSDGAEETSKQRKRADHQAPGRRCTRR